MTCDSPLPWDTLLAYRLGELDPAREAQIEEHYLGCAVCSRRLQELTALASDVRAIARASGVNVVVSDQFVRRLTENGLQVRQYSVPWNGSVNCTVAPDDDFVVARLEAPLGEVKRVDMLYLDRAGEPVTRHEDVPFVAHSGAVVISTDISAVRSLPETTLQVRLLAVDSDGEHTLGEYRFNHRPYNREGP